jgi:hypothetical protein
MRNESKGGESEERKRSKEKARKVKQNNNQVTRSTKMECKCGSKDHRRISLLRCPLRFFSKVEVAWNYEKRMSENVVPQNCDENTVDPTVESMSEATEQGKRESGECEEYVQSTSKYFGAS